MRVLRSALARASNIRLGFRLIFAEEKVFCSKRRPFSSLMDIEEGSVARKFWIKSQKKALTSAYTPFVICLAAGGLELNTFRHYIAQDVHFLKAFAQA